MLCKGGGKMVVLLAIDKSSGVGFAKIDDELVYLDIMYDGPKDIGKITEKDIEIAVFKRGFVPRHIIFDDISMMISYLKAEYMKYMTGFPEPTHNLIRDLLIYAPADIIEKYVTRIENELIPEGKDKIARVLAQDILAKCTIIENRQDLQDRLNEILELTSISNY